MCVSYLADIASDLTNQHSSRMIVLLDVRNTVLDFEWREASISLKAKINELVRIEHKKHIKRLAHDFPPLEMKSRSV